MPAGSTMVTTRDHLIIVAPYTYALTVVSMDHPLIEVPNVPVNIISILNDMHDGIFIK